MTASPTTDRQYWEDPQHCRKFFDKFAKACKFDPLDVHDWASADLALLRKKKVRVAFSRHARAEAVIGSENDLVGARGIQSSARASLS